MSSRVDARFCTGCGSPIESPVRLNYCPFCGNKDEGKKFCAECGSSLVDLPTNKQTQQPAASMAVQAAMSTQPSTTAPQPTPIAAQPTVTTTDTQQPAWGGAQQQTAAKLAKAYCPDCGNEATWVSQYSQWYCYVDQKYVATPSYSEPKKGLFRKH